MVISPMRKCPESRLDPNLAPSLLGGSPLKTPEPESDSIRPSGRELASQESEGRITPAGMKPEEPDMRPSLLIVEDDEVMRTVWQVIFSARGWRVESASTMIEGLRKLDPAPDYLILDLQLPDGSGETILRKVRESGLKTRVVITTGSNDPDQLSNVRELHPEALFRKPLNVADVWREGQRAVAF
ncbi:hypothetical protein BH23PLA1_BH23PLA1_19750 [soil metagenome]